MNVKQGIIRLLGLTDLLFTKQQKVGKNKKGSKIKQVTQFQGDSRFQPFFVVSERLENQDCNYKQNNISDQEKSLKYAVKKVAHDGA